MCGCPERLGTSGARWLQFAIFGAWLSTLQINILSRCQTGPNCLVGRIAHLNDRLLYCTLSQVHGWTTFRIVHQVSWPKDHQVPQCSEHFRYPRLQTCLPCPEDRFLSSIVHFPRLPNRFPRLMVNFSCLIPHSNYHRWPGEAPLAEKCLEARNNCFRKEILRWEEVLYQRT